MEYTNLSNLNLNPYNPDKCKFNLVTEASHFLVGKTVKYPSYTSPSNIAI